MSIELYVFPPSPRSFKVLALAHHLGLDFTTRMVDLRQGEQKAPHYAAVNPNMRVPTLVEDDFILWESNAILQYLAAKKPASGLLPEDLIRRCDVTRWQFWDLAHWDPACAIFVLEYVAKPLVLGTKQPDMAAIAKGTEAFNRAASVLDGHLKGRKFVSGDALTIADFSLGAAMNLADLAHFPMTSFAEIKRWHAGLCALPAWRATLEQTALPAAA
jgi:glutathione S-transferase